MSDNKVWDMEVFLNENAFDYVEYSVNKWKEWVRKVVTELEKVEIKEIRLLTYFSILEMMEQEYNNFHTTKFQDSFSNFVITFQNKYDFLHLTDPITLYYRTEKILSSAVNLDCFEDDIVYYPHAFSIRAKADEIRDALIAIKDVQYSEKKMKEHRYVDLLYRIRCQLTHEFSAHHLMFDKMEKEQPYYINCSRIYTTKTGVVRDEVWQLMFPEQFIKDLCINCFDNYMNYCLENHTPPNKNNGMDRFCVLSWYSR